MSKRLVVTDSLTSIIPCDIDQFNITNLTLSRNKITVLPKELFSLINLNIITLQGNNIRYIPKEIGALKKLEKLFISGDKIENIPIEISGLKSLSILWLDYVEIKFFPEGINICIVYLRTRPNNFNKKHKFNKILHTLYTFQQSYVNETVNCSII